MRLDRQSASIESATRLLLRASGIEPGMRVLDLGTGIGPVAMLIADMVGPEGRVVGIDNSAKLLDVAALRAVSHPQLRFTLGDVRHWRDDAPFDAVVGRLILFHLADPLAVLRHHAAALRPGGLLLALDFDLRASRAEPALPLIDEALGWVDAAFRHAGASPAIGTRLSLLLEEAGLAEVQGFGVQGYLAPKDPRGPALLAGVVRTWRRRSSRPASPRPSRSASTRSKHASPMRSGLRRRWCCHPCWRARGGAGCGHESRRCARAFKPAARSSLLRQTPSAPPAAPTRAAGTARCAARCAPGAWRCASSGTASARTGRAP